MEDNSTGNNKMAEQISNTSKVVRGLSNQTLVTLILGVLEIVSFSIMSRLLTQEDFGYYAALTAITVVFSTFADTKIRHAQSPMSDFVRRCPKMTTNVQKRSEMSDNVQKNVWGRMGK